jgi:hypothetical protein
MNIPYIYKTTKAYKVEDAEGAEVKTEHTKPIFSMGHVDMFKDGLLTEWIKWLTCFCTSEILVSCKEPVDTTKMCQSIDEER